ncbi:MAG: hypothetical protein AAF657_07475 [Acidobacteriota bacterium]
MQLSSWRSRTTVMLFVAASFALGYLWQSGPGALTAGPNDINLKQVKEHQLPTTVAGPPGLKSFTIYMGRKAEKIKAAQRMNALHDVMAAKGYTLHDLEPHWENSDLEGWWITYRAEGQR